MFKSFKITNDKLIQRYIFLKLFKHLDKSADDLSTQTVYDFGALTKVLQIREQTTLLKQRLAEKVKPLNCCKQTFPPFTQNINPIGHEKYTKWYFNTINIAGTSSVCVND